MWFVMSQKHGASALGLQRLLGLKSYQTAWTWLHKLRRAMVLPNRARLSGTVEVDCLPVDSIGETRDGRRSELPAQVLIGAELKAGGMGRIRMMLVGDPLQASAASGV